MAAAVPTPALPTDADQSKQTRTLITYTETLHPAIDDPHTHRAPIAAAVDAPTS